MSKKIIYKKHLLKGRFYLHDDRNGGHPAYLYKKIDRKNKYYIVLFTTSKGFKRKKLKHGIEIASQKQNYVRTSPFVTKRRELSKKELTRFKINKEDKPLIKYIERKKPANE